MIAWITIIGGVMLMSRIADLQNESPLMWGAITAALCIGAVYMPLPFFIWWFWRVLLALVAVYALMTARNMMAKR